MILKTEKMREREGGCLGESGISKVVENGVHFCSVFFFLNGQLSCCYFAFSTPIFDYIKANASDICTL